MRWSLRDRAVLLCLNARRSCPCNTSSVAARQLPLKGKPPSRGMAQKILVQIATPSCGMARNDTILDCARRNTEDSAPPLAASPVDSPTGNRSLCSGPMWASAPTRRAQESERTRNARPYKVSAHTGRCKAGGHMGPPLQGACESERRRAMCAPARSERRRVFYEESKILCPGAGALGLFFGL